MKKTVYFLLFTLFLQNLCAQEIKFDTPNAGNPIIPGYFADPTVQKFGDTYYIYATTDGNGGGLGPSQVWISKDFVNWSIHPMNWPSTHHIWAPDVMKKDDKYYFYYCQPCQIYSGVSDNPLGPWKNILGEDEAVLVPDRYVKMSITLDGQTFIDDDGSVYLYWGTWGIYPDHGCGVGKFNPDMKTFADTALIPNTQAIDFFEAPFVFKRKGIYYFTYSSGSCHDGTYRVQYATSKVGPMGPFEYADNNPILETSKDGTIHGPGHHSILNEGDDYYIVYHQHNNPHSTRGFHRQIAADKLEFDDEGRIKKIEAGHQGIGYLQKNTNPHPNLAFGKKVRASSYYNESFKPEYANDDNNGTLWRPKTTGEEWIEIDLGKSTQITRVWTQFEYATSFYQYIIETSQDGISWETFADRRNNTFAGSPMMDTGKTKARYVRLTVTGNEKNGLFGAIWNIKIFEKGKDPVLPAYQKFNGQSDVAAPERKGLIFEINADDYPMTGSLNTIANRKDKTQKFNAQGSNVPVRIKDNKSAFIFNGNQEFRSDFPLPSTFIGNTPYSITAWIFMESMSDNECILDLSPRGGELEKISFGYGKNPKTGIISHNGEYEDMGLPNLEAGNYWKHLVVTFDGYMEKIYIDGKLVREKDIVLRIPESRFITLGKRFSDGQVFKNCLHSIALYDIPLTEEEVIAEFEQSIPDSPLLDKKDSMNDVADIDAELIVRAISSQIIKVGVNMGANEYALLFNYKNLTTGKSSGWISDTEYFDSALEANREYNYEVKVKDTFGNEKIFNPAQGNTSENNFTYISDDFSNQVNYVKSGTANTIWTGLSGYKLDETTVEASNGKLTLISAGRNFRHEGDDNGPFLYYEVEGDFVAEVEVTSYSGIDDQRGASFNEGGLMIQFEQSPGTRGQEILHLGVFPYYNVGNIYTTLINRSRIQFSNNKSWNMDRFLQIERDGNNFYFRTSRDGTHWENLPYLPFAYPQAEGRKAKIGLYQVTYSENEGYISYDNFKLWTPK